MACRILVPWIRIAPGPWQWKCLTAEPPGNSSQVSFNYQLSVVFVIVHSLSRVQLFATPGTAAHQASLSTISRSLLKLTSIESVMPSNRLILCRLFLLLPSVFTGRHGLISVFTDKIPGLGRSPGEGKGYPLQYSGLENPMDCIVREVRSQRVRRDWPTFTFICWTIWK